MIWSGDPQFRTYERRARQARAQVFTELLATARRALARGVVEAASHLPRRFARAWPSV